MASDPLHDVAAEQAVLGAVLRAGEDDRDAAVKLLGICPEPADFYRPAHEILATHLQAAAEQGGAPLSPAGVLGRLMDADDLRQGTLDGPVLLDLVSRAAANGQVDWFANRVRRFARQRRMLASIQRAGQRLKSADPDDLDGALYEAMADLEAETGHGRGAGGTRFGDLYLPRSALAKLPKGEPLIDGVLDRRCIAVVSGRDQTYKSFLVLGWLCSLAAGHPWLGRHVEQIKVLYVVGEGAWGLDARISAWEHSWGEKVDDDWLHVRRAPVNLFRHGQAYDELVARVQAGGYGLVVFDTLQRMATGADQNSAKDAGEIVAALDAVRQATSDGTVGIVAHTGKSDTDTRGSSAFEDDADIVWHVKRDEDTQTIRAILAKRKDGPAGLELELRPKVVPDTGSLALESARGLPPTTQPKRAVEVLEILAGSAASADGMSATTLSDALGLKGRGSVHKALSWLIDKQYVQKSERGQWPSYKITPAGLSTLAEIRGHLL